MNTENLRICLTIWTKAIFQSLYSDPFPFQTSPDFRLPLSSELQYNMSEHVNSPASLLGNYCVYLKIYPGGKSCGRGPRKGVSAYLVFAPIYDSGHLVGVFLFTFMHQLMVDFAINPGIVWLVWLVQNTLLSLGSTVMHSAYLQSQAVRPSLSSLREPQEFSHPQITWEVKEV